MTATDTLTPIPPAPEVDTPPADMPEPSAPYGRDDDGTLLDKNGERAERGLKADGTAKIKPGPPPGTKAGAAVGKRTTAKPKPKVKGAKDYRPGIIGLIQLPVGIATGVGMAAGNDVLLADAYTIANYAEPLAEAVNDLAQENRALAGALEKVLTAGPYSALIVAVVPMVAQLARNHGVLPAGPASLMGAVNDPQDLAAAAKADMGNMAEAA